MKYNPIFKTRLTENNYKSIIIEDLLLKQHYTSIMEAAAINKIVVNTSSKHIISDKKHLLSSLTGIELITNQKGSITRAKKSIATYKVRKDQIIGAKVTLRNTKKISFFEKLLRIILPRLSEYQGTLSTSFDKKGNLNIGIPNVLVFPELEPYFQFFENTGGLDISIETSALQKKDGAVLFSAYQLPTFLIKKERR